MFVYLQFGALSLGAAKQVGGLGTEFHFMFSYLHMRNDRQLTITLASSRTCCLCIYAIGQNVQGQEWSAAERVPHVSLFHPFPGVQSFNSVSSSLSSKEDQTMSFLLTTVFSVSHTIPSA